MFSCQNPEHKQTELKPKVNPHLDPGHFNWRIVGASTEIRACNATVIKCNAAVVIKRNGTTNAKKWIENDKLFNIMELYFLFYDMKSESVTSDMFKFVKLLDLMRY